jgi:hypothetical protein
MTFCKTCKHWKSAESFTGAEEGWGECRMAVAQASDEPMRGTGKKNERSFGVAQYHPRSLVHAVPAGTATLVTSPDHGCGHWDGST